MKQVQAPPLPLVLKDEMSIGGTTLRATPSNMGEPYRKTMTLSLEKGVDGPYKGYEHLGSVELNEVEARRLRDFIDQRFPQEKRQVTGYTFEYHFQGPSYRYKHRFDMILEGTKVPAISEAMVVWCKVELGNEPLRWQFTGSSFWFRDDADKEAFEEIWVGNTR